MGYARARGLRVVPEVTLPAHATALLLAKPELAPPDTPTPTALAKDLKKRGWTFVGPTTVYAFMQAMGLVNDHVPGCDCREVCEAERVALVRPTPGGEG